MSDRDDLSALWRKARRYGIVDMFGQDDGTYSCNITFATDKHTKAQATSGHKCTSPEEAVEKAIVNAQKFIGEISDMEGIAYHEAA